MITFDTFDRQLDLIGETSFTAPDPGEMFLTLKLADLNGDGALDLIALSEVRSGGDGLLNFSLWTFLSIGDGAFKVAIRQDLIGNDLGTQAGSIAVADLNGDGKADVVVLLNGISLESLALLGNGDGTFRQQNLSLNSTGSVSMSSFAIADLNGDGNPDLVLFGGYSVTYLATVAVALGNGDGTFQAPGLFPIQPTTPNSTIAVGDVNDDGFPDIVTSSGSILFGDGKGGFSARRDYALSATGFVMLSDFDGDGKTDILIGTGNPAFLSGTSIYPSLTVLFGQGGGVFSAAPVSFAGVGGVDFTGESMAIADFDGDGIPDLVLAARTDGFAAILKGKGNGDFSTMFRANFNAAPVSVVVADFNRDGKPDVAVLLDLPPNGGGEVQVFLGKGDGTLAAPLVLPSPGKNLSFIGAPDLNGAGIPDLVVAAENTVSVWLGKPGGTFSSPASNSVPGGYLSSGFAASLAFGDFNGDGKLDIAIPSQATGSVTLLLGRGDATFSTGTPIPLTLPALAVAPSFPLGPTNVVAADFNGDGRLDLAVTIADDEDVYSGGLAVLLGNGDGTFQPPILNPAPATGITAADLNGDKIPDLIVTGDYLPGTAVLLGNGDGTFQPGVQLLTAALQAVAVADLNRDGTQDIAGGLISIGVAAFLNLSQATPSLTVVPAPTFAPGPLTPDSIASAFGRGLTNKTTTPSPAPAMVAGVTVTVLNSAGLVHPAPLFYSSPDQINFLIPAATEVGPATVTVSSEGGASFTVQVQIVPLAPALFTVGDAGIAAAYLTRVAPGNIQSIEPVFTVQSGNIVPAPIDLSSVGQVYLTLFGTGFDSGAGLASADVQGVNAQVTYGPQSQVPGLDQANILLPASLAGSGVSSVVLTIGGTVANTVYITIQ